MKTTMGNWVRTALLLAAMLGVKSDPEMTRIVGGVSVDITNFPYQLSMQDDGNHFCGASIIDSYWALTAAHCVTTSDVSKMTANAGSTTWNFGATPYKVTSLTRHPNYVSSPSTQYDIALVKVSTPFVFGPGVQAIALPAANTVVPSNTVATVSGWGAMTATSTDSPTQLQAVDVNIVDRETCQTLWTTSIPITDAMICAGGRPTGGKGSCMVITELHFHLT